MKPWYLASYESNSSDSRKDCNAIVLLGAPNWRDNNPNTPVRDHDWGMKYVTLPCPVCAFGHGFKRIEWNEAQELPNFMDNFEGAEPEEN